MQTPPSGRQYTLVHGSDRATVVEVGAGLRSYVSAGRELLDTYAEHEMASSGRGQVLVPWPNRVRDGAYGWEGVDYQLALSEPSKGNAIHGLVRFAPFSCVSSSSSRVELEYVLYPTPGYPFLLVVRLAYNLGPAGLTVETTATNGGTQALPYASGQHPYLAAPGGELDACTVTAPGATYFALDARSIPTGQEKVDGSAFDFREGCTLGAAELDHAYGELSRDADGLAWVQLRGPSGEGAELWLDESYPYVQLFTGDTLPEARRRQGLGVEPMTAPPNALQTGLDVRRLEPGESTTARWGLRVL